MVPKQPKLDPKQAEELFQILLGIVDEAVRGGDPARALSPVTLLNASRLNLVPELVLQPREYAVLGMLHWIRYCHPMRTQAEADAAACYFSHVFPVQPGLLPAELREHFEKRRPRRQPVWEIWHTHARVLFEEFLRDRGERLLDMAIILYRLSLKQAPEDYPHRPAMECNLGVALFTRYEVLREDDDLRDALHGLMRAQRMVAPDDPSREKIAWALRKAMELAFAAGPFAF